MFSEGQCQNEKKVDNSSYVFFLLEPFSVCMINGEDAEMPSSIKKIVPSTYLKFIQTKKIEPFVATVQWATS